ncbi:MarR family transcriptional regulator [Paenibacillus senegalensis]|uniref:MarR family transcriptional regulator n=1 Tax=Paenibacillus senegalensis TaxID=1465766 RepID=UPI0002885159|nr:MarR family transcriptional regulator [Paenibacillus senegalensis]
MHPAEGLKQLLYDRFLHFSHLTEQVFATEIGEFEELARLYGLASIPSNMTSVHVIDCIGNNEPINNTSIADKMKLSKASITKISTNLLKEGYIKRTQMKDNKKEVYFTLTPKGKQIFEIHAKLHEIIERRFKDVMDSFSEGELQAVLKFFQTMIAEKENIFKVDGKA